MFMLLYDVIAEEKPMTFSGSSYVGWRLTKPTERRLSLALQIKTVQQSARLMHAGGGFDYNILEVDTYILHTNTLDEC